MGAVTLTVVTWSASLGPLLVANLTPRNQAISSAMTDSIMRSPYLRYWRPVAQYV